MSEQTSSASIKKAGLGYIVGNYLIRGIGFLTLPIFSRLLSTEDFGVYNTFISYETILFVIVGLALHTSFKNAFYIFENNFDEYVSNTIFLSICNFILLLSLGLILSFFFPSISRISVFLILIHSFSSAIIAYFNSYVSLYFKSLSYIKVTAISAVGNILFSLILIFSIFNNDRGMGRILGTVIPTFIVAIFLIYHFFRKKKPTCNKLHFTYSLRYSLPLIPHGISQVFLGSVDRIMISSMIGEHETGIYSFTYALYSLVSVTYSSLDQVWAPWFYKQYKEGNIEVIRKKANQYAFSIGLFSVLVMLAGPEIVLLLGSKAYAESIQIVSPIMLGGFFAFMYSFPAVVEYYFQKTKYISVGTMLAALINLILNYIFLKIYGYKAAAYTTMVTYLIYFIFHYVIARKINNNSYLYDTKKFVYISLLVLVGSILAQFTIPFVIVRWLFIITIGLYLVVYLIKIIDIQIQIKKKK